MIATDKEIGSKHFIRTVGFDKRNYGVEVENDD